VPQSGLAIAGCVNVADNPGMRYREGTGSAAFLLATLFNAG
jgi:hypothetical protein